MKIKTIDINAREWFDRTYGNSYFSAQIDLNYGMKNKPNDTDHVYDLTIMLPFQYGYDNHYLYVAIQELVKRRLVKADKGTSLWAYCQDNNVILRHSKIDSLKKDLYKTSN